MDLIDVLVAKALQPDYAPGTDEQVADAVNDYLDTKGVPSLQPEAAESVANEVIGAPGFEEQINDAVEGYLDDHQPFFTLPNGGVRNQALLSDGHDGAKWGSQIPAFAEDPNAPASGTEFEPVPIETEVFANRKWVKSGSYTEPDGWYSSNKIAVVPGMTYKVYNNPRYYHLWDENGTNGTDIQTATAVSYEFTVPEGRYYVGFFDKYTTTPPPFTMFRTSPTAEEEAALNDPNLKAPNLSLSLANFKADSVVKSVVPLKDAKIVNFGDSVFGNFSYPEDVSTYLAGFTGADVYNCGFGGTKMATHANANYALFSFHALIDAVVSGDFSAQEAALASSWQNPTTYPVRLATLKAIDFDDVDIITIAYGTNDWNSGYAIDNEQNPKDLLSYCGAFRYGVEKLLTAYPHIRVYTCTPIFRTRLDDNHQVIEYSDTWTVNGHTLPDFVAALKAVSAEYGIKCVDNYFELGFNKMNRLIYYRENDGTHPSPAGRERIARHIAEEIY